jgi:hypothetical protein
MENGEGQGLDKKMSHLPHTLVRKKDRDFPLDCLTSQKDHNLLMKDEEGKVEAYLSCPVHE